MKPAAEMSEAGKEQACAWFRRWDRLGPILDELRWDSIRHADTQTAIASFDGAFETAVRLEKR